MRLASLLVRRAPILARAVLVAAGVAACSDPAPPFDVRESVEQLHVTHAPPQTALAVYDSGGNQVAAGTTDDLGSLMFRELAPGDGYRVATTAAASELSVKNLTVMSVASSLPAQSFYRDQQLAAGSQYIVTRDGTTLSAYVTFPAGDPPYPTVVTYSGYDPSRPGEPVDDGTLSGLCGGLPAICDAPNDASALIAAFFGYATVNVNVRGTGCSGGAFDFYEPLQRLDGYDIIETVAAQPWVMNGMVGMVGLSYPGNS